jgi:hypothetical protein
MSPFFSVGMKTTSFEQKLDKATQSDIHFSVAVGEMNLSGGAKSDMLVSGSAGLPKEMTLNPVYSAPKDGKSSLTLEGNGVVIVPVNTNTSPWNFNLNSKIPIDLSTEMGVGQMRIDLSGTHVAKIKTEMGVGQTIIILPSGEDVDATVSGAVGELVIRVPKGCDVMIKTDKAVVGSDIPDGYVRDHNIIRSPAAKAGANKINLNIDLAVGSIVVEEID